MDSLGATQRAMLAAIVGDERAPDGLVDGSVAFSAQHRLEVYRRGYRLRLVGCLREAYPALRHALGEELFEAFALDYLEAHPPAGYTLNALGARWAEHLDATRPQGGELWPDFLVDLARVERAFAEVYDGDGEQRVVPTRYPVAAYVAAARRGEEPPMPERRPSRVAVGRRDWVVTLTEASDDEALSTSEVAL